jgi:hypothetical protein
MLFSRSLYSKLVACRRSTNTEFVELLFFELLLTRQILNCRNATLLSALESTHHL